MKGNVLDLECDSDVAETELDNEMEVEGAAHE